eukprot:332275-Chlamydomonas_euryale.AAC.1
MDGWMDGYGWMDGWMDGWMVGRTSKTWRPHELPARMGRDMHACMGRDTHARMRHDMQAQHTWCHRRGCVFRRLAAGCVQWASTCAEVWRRCAEPVVPACFRPAPVVVLVPGQALPRCSSLGPPSAIALPCPPSETRPPSFALRDLPCPPSALRDSRSAMHADCLHATQSRNATPALACTSCLSKVYQHALSPDTTRRQPAESTNCQRAIMRFCTS